MTPKQEAICQRLAHRLLRLYAQPVDATNPAVDESSERNDGFERLALELATEVLGTGAIRPMRKARA